MADSRGELIRNAVLFLNDPKVRRLSAMVMGTDLVEKSEEGDGGRRSMVELASSASENTCGVILLGLLVGWG